MAIVRTRDSASISMIEAGKFQDLDGSPVKFSDIGDAVDFVCDDERAKYLLQFPQYQLVSPESIQIQVNGPQGGKIAKTIQSCVEKTPEQADTRWAGEDRDALVVLAELHNVHIHKNWKVERILTELRTSIPKE